MAITKDLKVTHIHAQNIHSTEKKTLNYTFESKGQQIIACRTESACYLFLYSLLAKNNFQMVGKKKIKRRITFCGT